MKISNEAKQAADEWWDSARVLQGGPLTFRQVYAIGYDTATAKLELELQRANAKCAEQAAATAKLREELEATRDVVIRLVKLAHQQPSASVRTHDFGEVYTGKQASATEVLREAIAGADHDATLPSATTAELVVTKDGVPFEDQAEGIRQFKEASLRKADTEKKL